MAPQVPTRQRQGVMQVGALFVNALQPGQFGGAHRAGMSAESDDLQRIRTESRAHQLIDRQCGPFHRQPPVLHHHRERGVDEQCDHRLGAGLSLGDLDVVDGDPDRAVGPLGSGAAQHSVGDGSGDVPGFGVAELPRPGGPGQLSGRPRAPGFPFAVSARKLLGHIAQRRLPELAHGLRRQSPLSVRPSVQETLIHQCAFQLGQRAGVDGGLVAELAGQRVEVDVVHGGPGVALRKLLGQLLEFADIGQRLRALAHAEWVVAGELR